MVTAVSCTKCSLVVASFPGSLPAKEGEILGDEASYVAGLIHTITGSISKACTVISLD